MACVNCEEFTCVEPVPTCTSFLNIGTPFDATTGSVRIYVQKNINGETLTYIQKVDAYAGGVLVDLNKPREQFFNEFDGIYVMWVTNMEDDRGAPLLLTIDGVEFSRFGVPFVRTRGKQFNEVTVEPIV